MIEHTIDLETAQRVMIAAVEMGKKLNLRLSVAVAGRAGDLKAFVRMDGASLLSGETARRKAYTVAATGMSTQEFGSILKSDMGNEPELFHGMLGIDNIIAFAGGVPILLDNERIGAVAVSGGTSAEDQKIAEASAGSRAS